MTRPVVMNALVLGLMAAACVGTDHAGGKTGTGGSTPATGGTGGVATVLAVIRRYTRQPSVAPMSDQWLLSHQAEFGRDQY